MSLSPKPCPSAGTTPSIAAIPCRSAKQPRCWRPRRSRFSTRAADCTISGGAMLFRELVARTGVPRSPPSWASASCPATTRDSSACWACTGRTPQTWPCRPATSCSPSARVSMTAPRATSRLLLPMPPWCTWISIRPPSPEMCRWRCPSSGTRGCSWRISCPSQERRKLRHGWRETDDWMRTHPLADVPGNGGLSPSQVIRAIAKAFPSAIVTTEVGQNQMWTAQYYDFHEPRTFLTSGGLGTMGYGFPAAIGAQLGNPDRRVIDIAGDGSIQMNIQELGTAVAEKVPVIVAILNNGYLGMVRQWQESFHARRYSGVCLNRACRLPPGLRLARGSLSALRAGFREARGGIRGRRACGSCSRPRSSRPSRRLPGSLTVPFSWTSGFPGRQTCGPWSPARARELMTMMNAR